jgi:hypothetical protein
MIQRLIDSLQALAAPADVQLARFPDFVVKVDELALDFDDALLLVRDCQQLQLTVHQRDALADVETALNDMGGLQRSELWTERALRTSPRWAEIRQRARAALVVLGLPVADPGPSRAGYVR